jgi:hypothetical protein
MIVKIEYIPPIHKLTFWSARLCNSYSVIVELPPPKRKQIVQILDAFLGSEKAKKTG